MAEAPAAAAAEHLQPLGSKGQSPSWKRYKANALSIAWQMLLMMRQDQHPHLTKHPLPHNAAKFLDQTKEAFTALGSDGQGPKKNERPTVT